jgi:L-fuconolactonase
MAKPSIARAEIDEWKKQFSQLARYPNVYCKLSGLVTEADWSNWKAEDLKPYVEVALEYFGSQRLMFGSDWPVCLLAASYDQVLEVAEVLVGSLSKEERERIFSANAKQFYRIGEQAQAA